ncbi:FmdB family transcriptional regulator [Modestobacter sp. VKM Ac-2983]|uniref:FmdB family zinc ribbon protein n=1 Tax=Modestobacter sp. VKM Ac-2983 TaxID=3004137 RepID=UPI0022AB7358|nr:FmdB family zinc ribbon protein [Modestobacter sp. VKM Ac-2983]MCZ2804066.1 FmdB family transcriptional regulator [Modestobacter sp. VKM Ac-2983]
MPTYQYACTNPEVKHEFEVVQSFTDPAVATCTECEAPVRKVYGSVGVVFKGSGFYRTDSRKGEGSSTGSGSAKESSGGGKESGSKDAGSKDSGGSKESGSKTSGTTSSGTASTSSSSSSSGGSGGKAAN